MKFSILIPAYKARFLKECIESILAQTCPDFELIIVNDASPEDLTSIVKSFDDSRIHYFVNERNCGAINVVDNWNKCFAYAKGDYVICMGDDDKLLPCYLEEYGKLIEKHPGLGIYHAWTEIIDEHSQVIIMQEARPEVEGVYSMLWGRWNGRIQFIGDFLFERKRLVEQGGFYKIPLAWASDDISAYRAAQEDGIANMQVPGFQYRINAHTISNTGNVGMKLDASVLEEEWYKTLLQHEPDVQAQPEHLYWRMAKAYLPNMMMKKRIFTIAKDMQHNGFIRICTYIRQRKRYRLSGKMIVYAIIETLKIKNAVKWW